MKVTIQVIVEAGDGTAPVVQEVARVERDTVRPETLGLTLAEAKGVLQGVQQAVAAQQVADALEQHRACPDCGALRARKDQKEIVVRSLFGTLRLPSPRLYVCPCQTRAQRSTSPLAEALPERTTPELRYLEAKFAGLVSYGLSAALLAEVFPLGRPLHATAVRHDVQAVAQRLEAELGPEQPMFIDGCQADRESGQ